RSGNGLRHRLRALPRRRVALRRCARAREGRGAPGRAARRDPVRERAPRPLRGRAAPGRARRPQRAPARELRSRSKNPAPARVPRALLDPAFGSDPILAHSPSAAARASHTARPRAGVESRALRQGLPSMSPTPSFVRALFAGRLESAAILPYPRQTPEESETTEA